MTEKEVAQSKNAAYEQAFCKRKNLQWVNLPVTRDSLPEQGVLDRYLDLIANHKNTATLIHCEQGIVRTSMMVAIFLKIRKGLSMEAISRTLPRFGHSINNFRRIKQLLAALEETIDSDKSHTPGSSG